MSLPVPRFAFATLLFVAGCRGPLVGGELSDGGEGSGAGSGSGSTGGADVGSVTGGPSGGNGTAGSTGTGTPAGGSDGTSGSSTSGGSSGSGSGSGGSSPSGGDGADGGADSSGGESGAGGAASGGAEPAGGSASGCDSCEPELRVAGADGAIQYAKCSAMNDGVVYQSLLDLSASAVTPDVVVRAVAVESGDAVTLSGADEAISIFSGDIPVLAIDDAFVYWFSRTRDDGDVMRLRRRALAGGGAVENLVGMDTALGELGGKPKAMAAGAGYVYWSSGHEGVFRCPTTAACDAPELVIAGSEDALAPLPDVLGLDLDGDTFYWADTTTGEVRRRVASGTEDLLDTVAEPLIQICDVSFDGGSLFWILCVGTYEVRRVDPSGPSSVLLATTADTLDETAGGDLLVLGDDVYFISSDYLYQVPRDGSAAAQRLAAIYRSGAPGIHTVVGADEEDVFLVDEEGGILSVPR